MGTPTERIVCLPPHRLAAGMRVARAVLRADGGVLMPEGTTLDDDELGRLVQRGVEFVFVAVPETRDAQTIADEEAATLARLAHIFRPVSDAPDDSRAALRGAVSAWRLGQVR